MKIVQHVCAFSVVLFLGALAEPGAAIAGGFIKTTTYDVEVDTADLEGVDVGGFPMRLQFVYGGCCMMHITDEQIPHMQAGVESPFFFGLYEPISEPPLATPRPCEGGIGHCSAGVQMWDEMEMVDVQFLYVHITALPANLGAWGFNEIGSYMLKPGDTSEVRFQLNTDFGRINGFGRVWSVETTVPEPATWALLVAGFGVVGSALRRRLPGKSSAGPSFL